MTEEQCDVGIGRLVKQYAEAKKQLTVLENTLATVQSTLQNVIHDIHRSPDHVRLDAYMDRAQLSELLADLQEIKKEKARLEHALKQAGLGELVTEG